MAYVYLNGEILPEEAARVGVNDRSILFGDAAYETMRSYGGRFFRFPDHLDRLRHTVQGMGLTLPFDDEAITGGATALLEKNGMPDARLRLTLTGGRHEGAIRLARPHPPNLILASFPLPPLDPALTRDGAEVLVSPWRVHSDSPLPRIKTVNRLVHLMAKEEAIGRGAYESLFLDEAGGILEGTATNVFFVLEGALVTPGLDAPLLPGVTRDVVLSLAREAGMTVREETVGLERAKSASEAFLTGSTIELLPVRSLDGARIGDGRPGTVWRDLAERYRAVVARETGTPA